MWETEVEIREANASDIYSCAQLIASHEHSEVEVWRRRFEADFDDPHRRSVVGTDGDTIIGYGHTVRHIRPVDAGDKTSPSGFFLSGLLVAPEYRRHGVGNLLTVAQLQALKVETNVAFYVADPDNIATIRLHRQLGFVEERSVVRQGRHQLLFRIDIV